MMTKEQNDANRKTIKVKGVAESTSSAILKNISSKYADKIQELREERD